VVYEQAHEDANIIIGSVIDENLQDEVIVTIIATDFERPVAEVKEEVVVERIIPQLEEVIITAANIQKEEPVIQPLPLATEMEEEELVFETEEHQQQDENESSFGHSNNFGCAVDSKDLDIPTFMRQKNE
jgi:cell division GTPase FtsZ